MGEIRTYSTDELMGSSLPVLPGWRYPGTLPTIIDSLEKPYSWNPVLSVSIFRDKPNTPGKIEALTLIRGHSTTHEDVVSTLTGQIPTEQVAPFLRKRERHVVGEYPRVTIGMDGPNPRETAAVATYRAWVEGVPDPGETLPFWCHDIMSRKLGRADLIAMQSDDELGTASLARLAIGVSYTKDDVKGRARFERLFMVGVAFMLHPHYAYVFDADYHERMSVLPPHKRRYRNLGWTSIDSFSDAVQSRDTITLAPYVAEHNAATACVRGQCLAMTSLLIDAPDLRWHLGRGDISLLNYGQPIGDPYGLKRVRKR